MATNDMHIDTNDGVAGSWLGFCFTAMTATATFFIQNLAVTVSRLETVSGYAAMVLPIIASLSGIMTIAYTLYKWNAERKHKKGRKNQ